jgi:hypothetical protein
MDGDAIREVVATAVEAAKEELDYREPVPVREQPTSAAPETRSSPDNDDESGDDGAGPSAEDLASIERNPRHKEIYRNMVRGFHTRMGDIAEQDREVKQAVQAVEAIRRDPVAAAKAFAGAVGLRIEGDPASAPLRDRVLAKLSHAIGAEAAEVLGPAMLELVADAANDAIGPVTSHIAEQRQNAENSAIQQEISTFAQRVAEEGGDFSEDVQVRMAELVLSGKVKPGTGTTYQEFLEMLHSQATATRARAARRASAERGRREDGGTIMAGMNPREAARIAVAAARRELGR